MEPIAPEHHASVLWRGLTSQLETLVAARGAHPARTVVLVPYAQLMPIARAAWAASSPNGFTPRFETTMNWAGGAGFVPESDDIAFDMGRDLLTAHAWLERAGLAARADLLAARLVDVAWQLAGVACAVPPAERAAWARTARVVAAAGADTPALALEAAVSAIGVEWAAASAYASDILLQPQTQMTLDLLVVLEGFQPDAITQALCRGLGDRCVTLPLDRPGPAGAIALHVAADPSHEAEMTAACVVRHVDAGRTPVALAAVDRLLTRRVRAMLEARGLSIRDETGWKLSTTRAAAQLMAALRACAWDASSDQVIDWLKNTPAAAPRTVSALERHVRREGLCDWGSVRARTGTDASGRDALVDQANQWRETLQGPRALTQWLQVLRELLRAGGQWPLLERDAAGVQLLEALGLDDPGHALWRALPQAARRLTLAQFSAWVGAALEAASFRPAHPPAGQVVILPLPQALARPFGALVLGGCDEQRLPASPEPPGLWTTAQREQLGLPSRAALQAELRAGWRSALQTPHCDLLWRCSDDAGEPVLASALVQALRLDGDAACAACAADPRARRELAPAPVTRPLPVAQDLPVHTLSASGYEDLRHCPYRFHALRQLGLQEASEIDSELDKRDFGNWLHKVLHRFHAALQASGNPPDAAQLEGAAQAVTREMGMDPGEFLPFAAAWPATRGGYLAWLASYAVREGGAFASGETEHQLPLGSVTLVGRIDRIDRLPDGRRLVMDYKTESPTKTSARVKQPAEDTQLGFYAALLEDDTLRAAYVNVGERGKTQLIEQPEIVAARDLLVEGILHDLREVAGGAPLPALGEGPVCGYCAARGVCRRDFWNE